MVVGALYDDVGSNADQGSAYIFIRSGPNWVQQQQLFAADGAAGDLFGSAVAIRGETVIVGAVHDDGARGSAYVFVRNGTNWSQQQKLIALDGAAGNNFGVSVALAGETALVGAYATGPNQGSAYVFIRNGVSWSQQQKLQALDASQGDFFGFSVALSGETALIGSLLADGTTINTGAAYVFLRSGVTWTQQHKLTAPDGGNNDSFGVSVALSGETALVGANDDDLAGADRRLGLRLYPQRHDLDAATEAQRERRSSR